MFIKFDSHYSSKIDFKVIYSFFHSVESKTYFELRNIVSSNMMPASLDGKEFYKFKNLYFYFKDNSFNNLNNDFIYKISSMSFDISLLSMFDILNYDNEIYYAIDILKYILINKPFNDYSYMLASFIFNAILFKYKYIPIVFTNHILKIIETMCINHNDNIDIYCYLKNLVDQSNNYINEYADLSKYELLNILNSNKDILINQFNISELYLHGSFARETQNSYSDVDLIYQIDKQSDDCLEDIKRFLTSIIKRPIDLTSISDIKNFNLKVDEIIKII